MCDSENGALHPDLLQGVRQGLWHVGNHHVTQSRSRKPVLDTGFDELNRLLHLAGWPLATTTEIGLDLDGLGELRLLIPALRQAVNQSHKELIWIAPPYFPGVTALIREQIDISKLTIIDAKSKTDILWCAEEALSADCCAAVFTWTGRFSLDQRESRRLQLATERTQAWHVQFRDSHCLRQPSAAQLRINLQVGAHNKLELEVQKQPAGWGGQRCNLSLSPGYENWQRIATAALPVPGSNDSVSTSMKPVLSLSQTSKLNISSKPNMRPNTARVGTFGAYSRHGHTDKPVSQLSVDV